MLSRRLIVLAAGAVIALGTGAARAAHHDPNEAGGSRPNIVVIETDDQTIEQMRVLTRTLDLIGAQGITFDNSFVSLSLCCPSRATFLTGQYAHNHGDVSNYFPFGGYQKLDHTKTLAVWLQRAGYKTSFVGKYLNGYINSQREIPPGWNDWHAAINLTYFVYKMNDNGKVRWHGSVEADYQTNVFTRRATNEIRSLSLRPQPFFLWVSYFAPHAGGPKEYDDPPGFMTTHPAPKYKGLYKEARLPKSASFNEGDVSDKPFGVRNRPVITGERIAAIRDSYEQELESLRSVDDGVERIVDALRAAGELDNTFIIFTDDNGYFHGEHRIPSGKVLVYEPSVRVPLLVRGPGVPQGLHLSQLVSNVDLAPTILDLAGAKPRGRVLDGRSLVPLFDNPASAWDTGVLLERLPNTASVAQGDGPFAAIHTKRYLYAEYDDGERELYDLAVDPDELRNVDGDPAYASVEEQLGARLADLRDCSGAGCRAAVAP